MTTIRDVLLPALRERFPDRRFVSGHVPDPIVVFPAAHPAVGSVSILDDGVEATILIGELTHSHFNPCISYDSDMRPDEIARAVTDSVLEFLEDLFADRVLVWCVPGRSGGYQLLTDKPPDIPTEAHKVVWSGPWTGRIQTRAGPSD